MKKIIAILTAFFVPAIALAQLTGTGRLITQAQVLVRQATILVAALALLVFFFGLVKFIMKAGDKAAKEEGRNLMIWGTIALFVMVSIWGIVYWIGDEILPGQGYAPPAIPVFNQ